MSWEIIREGSGSLLAAKVKKCVDCSGGVNCPMDVFISAIRHAPTKMTLDKMAEEAGLTNIEGSVDLIAGGQRIDATCHTRESKIAVVITSKEGFENLNIFRKYF